MVLMSVWNKMYFMRHLLNVSILSHFLTSKIYGWYTPNAITRYDDKKKTHPAEINRQQKKIKISKNRYEVYIYTYNYLDCKNCWQIWILTLQVGWKQAKHLIITKSLTLYLNQYFKSVSHTLIDSTYYRVFHRYMYMQS